MNHLRPPVYRRPDSLQVKPVIRQQIHLPVRNAIFRQTSNRRPDADHFFQRIIRLSGYGKQFITWTQICRQRNGQRMGAAGNLRTDQRRFCMKSLRINLLQRISSQIIVSITAATGKMHVADSAFLHGMEHLQLVVFCIFINFRKAFFQLFFYFLTICTDFFADAHAFIHFLQIHLNNFLFP